MKRSSPIIVLFCAALALFAAGCARAPVKSTPPPVQTGIPAAAIQSFDSAEAAYGKGRFDEAMALYNELLRRFPSGRVAFVSHLRKGEIFASRGEYDQAIEELTLLPAGFEKDPLSAEARYYLALSHMGLKQYEPADEIVKALLHETVPSYLKATVEYLKGDILAQKGDQRGALNWYLRALGSGPEKGLKGSIQKKAGEIITTFLSLYELTEMEEEYTWGVFPSGYIAYGLAKASYRARDFDGAERYLERLLSDTGHPLLEEAKSLSRRIVAARLVNPTAIGCVLPLTGRYASYGRRVLDAIILASGVFDPWQDTPIELFIEDSKGDPATAREAMKRLATEHRVIGIIGPLGSAASQAAAEEAQELGTPTITLTQMMGITETGNYVFRNFLTGGAQIHTLVSYAMQNLGIMDFAILYPSDPYGTEMMYLFWDEVLRQGGTMRGVETYVPGQTTDFSGQIKALVGLNQSEEDEPEKKTNPVVDFDALFIPDSPSVVSMIAPQLAFYDVIGVQLMGTNIWNSLELLKENNEYLEGAIFTDCFFLNSTRPEVREFIDRFYVAWGREPDSVEALAYETAQIIVKLIAEGAVEIREDLRDQLSRIENYPGITGTISFLDERDAQRPLHILAVVDNEIIRIRP